MATPKLGMTTLVEGQTNSEATVNTAIQDLDVLLPLRIEDNDITAPPGSPTNGHAYYIAAGTSPSGDWSGKAGKIAVYNSGWRFFDPVGGMTAFIHDEGELVYWHSQASEWFQFILAGVQANTLRAAMARAGWPQLGRSTLNASRGCLARTTRR